MKRKTSLILGFLLAVGLFMGCSRIDSLKVKYGMKNLDFEFMTTGDIDSIIIQSTRDLGFRFIVTDPSTIRELYTSLSSAKKTTERITHDADYIFEFHDLDGNVRKYSYVAGMSDQQRANFYNEEDSYIVTDRIDNNLIRNLYSLRKPKYFEEIYYGTLLELMASLREEFPDKTMGIRLYGDSDILKYQLSKDIENFRTEALQWNTVVLNPGEKSDIVLEVKTQGFTTLVYKAVVTLKMESESMSRNYYIYGKYSNDLTGWETLISETKPEGF